MVTQCTVPYEIVLQGTVVKLDGDGNISWIRSYGEEGLTSAWSVLEDQQEGGFIVAGFSSHPQEGVNLSASLLALRLDSDGNPLGISRIDEVEYYQPPAIRSGPDGLDLQYVHTTLKEQHFDNKPAIVHIGRNGSVSAPEVINASVITTWTSDEGYFFAGFSLPDGPDYGEAIFGRADRFPLHAIRLGPDGTVTWDREIRGVVVNYVRKVIQTSDGGYVILAMREN